MNQSEWELIDATLQGHSDAVRGKDQWTDAAALLYCRNLVMLDHRLVAAAIAACERRNKFLPQVSEILAAAVEIELSNASATGRAFPGPEEAWLEVRRFCGRERVPAWCHPAVHRAVELQGGHKAMWHELEHAGTPEGIVKKHFLDCYSREVEDRRAQATEALYRPERPEETFPAWTAPKVHLTPWRPAEAPRIAKQEPSGTYQTALKDN